MLACVCGTRSTGGVSAADDVCVASVLRGVRGDGGVCEVLFHLEDVFVLIVMVWAESGLGAWKMAYVVM